MNKPTNLIEKLIKKFDKKFEKIDSVILKENFTDLCKSFLRTEVNAVVKKKENEIKTKLMKKAINGKITMEDLENI